MKYIKKIIKRIKILYFEYKLRKTYKEDTYVYEDEENFNLKK
jgi:hypothetical protein